MIESRTRYPLDKRFVCFMGRRLYCCLWQGVPQKTFLMCRSDVKCKIIYVQVEWSCLTHESISQILLKQPSDSCWWDKGTRTMQHSQAVTGSLLLAWLALSFMDFSLGSKTVSIRYHCSWTSTGWMRRPDCIWDTWRSVILLSPTMASPGSVRLGIFELSNLLLLEQGGFFFLFS